MRLLGVALRTLAMVLGVAVVGAVAPAPALAGAWWHVNGETMPAHLAPGKEGQVVVYVSDLGDEPVEGATNAVTIANKLSQGLTATGISAAIVNGVASECQLATLQCSFTGALYPYEAIPITIKVKVAPTAAGPVSDLASVGGGGVPATTRTLGLAVGSEPAGYGVAGFEQELFNADGLPATQAGSHPFQITTTLTLNGSGEQPVELPKDFAFHLPSGLIGDPTAVEQCTMANFFALVDETNLCSPGSVVGVATVTADEPRHLGVFTKTVPVFNLVPNHGEPARFGINVIGKVPIVLDTALRSTSDYGVDVTVDETTETAGLLSSQVTFWGEPGDPLHDNARGWECVAGGLFDGEIHKTCPASSQLARTPFLTLPSSCAANREAEPVVFSMDTDSWADPEAFADAQYTWTNEDGELLGFEECSSLAFTPSIDVKPEQHTASTPTGVSVEVTVPQEGLTQPDGRAESDLRDTTVALPEGVQLSPSAASGLVACPETAEDGYEGVGFEGFEKVYGPDAEPGAETAMFTPKFRFVEEELAGRRLAPSCPEGSKLGTVHIKTPLLSSELEGAVYLASPAPNGEGGRNPFDSLVALYLVAEDREAGILVKLAGRGEVNEATGQVTTTFSSSPQVPFEQLRLELLGGPRASLATPAHCGDYATNALFTPWSGTGPVDVDGPGEEFAVDAGAGGSACPGGALPFSAGFVANNTNTAGGGFTSFELELSRPDGDQALDRVTMHLPEGVAALLSSVELCSEAQALATACPAGSQIGEATAVAGLGSEPYVQDGGRVYITGPYDGAPFGLEIVTPADAGPFNLGYISVRSKLQVNPENASVTVESDPLPTEIRGIPLQLKRVLVDVNRGAFEFNPTNCGTSLSVQGTLTGAEGGSWSGSSAYPVTGCSSLPFNPGFSAGAVGHGSKADGTTFKVTVTSGGVNAGGVVQAGIAKVDLQLPKQLSSRLPTLQKACTEAAFAANPASCPEGSVIGAATIHTPVLRSALAGPAYLVSHGNAAFPDVEFVLQGEGIELVLDGKTQIKDGITYSKFESTPDAPFTTFETVLPAGPHGVLTPNVAESKHFDLCGETLTMPTTIVGQNGAAIEHNTKIAIEGCSAVKSAKVKKLTRAQLLTKALQACRHKFKHRKHGRLQCEKQARKRYTAHKAGRKHKQAATKHRG